jgi:hypothetical protein
MRIFLVRRARQYDGESRFQQHTLRRIPYDQTLSLDIGCHHSRRNLRIRMVAISAIERRAKNLSGSTLNAHLCPSACCSRRYTVAMRTLVQAFEREGRIVHYLANDAKTIRCTSIAGREIRMVMALATTIMTTPVLNLLVIQDRSLRSVAAESSAT